MLNRLSIIGNLTKDPEIKNISDQMSVCRFSIAVNKNQYFILILNVGIKLRLIVINF